MTVSDEIAEASAREEWRGTGTIAEHDDLPFDQVAPGFRAAMVARHKRCITAALPLIEAQVRREIAAELDRAKEMAEAEFGSKEVIGIGQYVEGTAAGLAIAASMVRGDGPGGLADEIVRIAKSGGRS